VIALALVVATTLVATAAGSATASAAEGGTAGSAAATGSAELVQAQRRLEAAKAEASKLEKQLAAQREAVKAAEAELDDVEAALRAEREETAERAAALYKNPETTDLATIVGSEGPATTVRKAAYIESVDELEATALARLDAEKRSAQARQNKAQAEQRRLSRRLERTQARVAELSRKRNDYAEQLVHGGVRATSLVGGNGPSDGGTAADREQVAALARRAQVMATASRKASRSGDSGEQTALSLPVPGEEAPWVRPADGKITSEFGRRWGRLHAGLDVAAPRGASIRAAQAGVVIFAGRNGGYGNLTLVAHGGGYTTAYAHQSAIAVEPGQRVDAGEIIGESGSTGKSTGPHLHFEVHRGGEVKDPRTVLGAALS
jgi:murein DD-endopeptidase MepM/ murein hydrolase activator NlpD